MGVLGPAGLRTRGFAPDQPAYVETDNKQRTGESMMTDAFVLGGVRTPFAQLTPRWSMNRSRNDTWTDPIPTMAHSDAPLTLTRQKESTVPTTASEGLDLQRPGRTTAGIGPERS